jgi:hypothetical protein
MKGVVGGVNRNLSLALHLFFTHKVRKEIAMDFDKAFSAIEGRAAQLRLTEKDAVIQSGVSLITYWRAKKGKTQTAARVRALKGVEDYLTSLETGT